MLYILRPQYRRKMYKVPKKYIYTFFVVSVLFVLVNCLGGLRMPEIVCVGDRIRQYHYSVYLAVKHLSNKIHIIILMM